MIFFGILILGPPHKSGSFVSSSEGDKSFRAKKFGGQKKISDLCPLNCGGLILMVTLREEKLTGGVNKGKVRNSSFFRKA